MIGDLVVCSLEPWDEVWRRNQFLVSGLLDRDPRLRVLFVEPAIDPLHELARRRRPRRARGVRSRAEFGPGRLWTYQQYKLAPRQLAGPLVDAALTAGVHHVSRRLGIIRPLLWINDPGRAPLARRSGWPALYDITDDWLVADRPARERDRVAANEAELMRRCAEVVVCSAHLARAKGSLRPVELIPNAVDVERYRRPATRPADLSEGSVAVYVGTLHEDRLDVDLCVRTARESAGTATLVFVGPNALSPANTARLAREPNVVLLGARPVATVPGYLQHATVLMTPHVVSAFTESLDPIKLYEYLAVDRPVVSTPVAGFRDRADVLTVATADEFPAAVHRCLTGAPQRSNIRAAADLPTWSTRVEQMRTVLERVAATG